MRVVDPGHAYDLASLDGNRAERLVFVKREGPRYPGNVGSWSGTTSQEVLRALIDRARYVDRQIPAWETRLSVWLLRGRAARIHGRRLPLRVLPRVEQFTTCAQCGHVGCFNNDCGRR